jgi:hypothetical protein
MKCFLINPLMKSVSEITIEDMAEIRSMLGRIECGHPLPGWIAAVELEGSKSVTHFIDGHMCAGRTILYPIDETSKEYYLVDIWGMVQWAQN